MRGRELQRRHRQAVAVADGDRSRCGPSACGSCGVATGPASVRIGSVRPELRQERALPLGAGLQRQHAGADVGGVQEDLAHGERPALRMQVLDGVGDRR